MLIAALRDLQWRKRRFVIAIVGTGLVFAMTLVLTGLANGFRVEATRTVDALGIDGYLVKSGAPGPFLGSSPFPPTPIQQIARLPGVTLAVPLVYGSATMPDRGSARNVNVFGAPQRGPGMPAMSAGRPPSEPTEIAVSSTMGRTLGDRIEIGSRTMDIVGMVDDSTALAGQPNVFLTVEGAQQLLFSGQRLISSIGLRGAPTAIPDGFRAVDRAGAIEDLSRALNGARRAMTLMAGLLWVVAALIVGSMIYVSAIERTRDFAVFKAVGVPARSILGGLAVQAIIVAVLAAVLGGALSVALGPLFPMRVDIPTAAFVALPILAVAIGLLASVAGLRRAVTVDPALAFGGP
ncbi:glutamine ABC transporter permease [Mycobacterium sp. CVI_P3]|uniref:Glutamine ABC transporter permease n=1 Tax=Mycobacterium pinniadriaticum TaxID=2994102 RepID=A0ABT3SAX0_9MYCO|nr:FtsX-like permease family protein [Mycobacterium pinniadriaticum]MCX2930282.1 glutamine ABC transporter permease [Mycobacterium pinniadriaticum]MCX2936656.1 glutamine ABC transporter permease [Mycobacterium pinniadriaticum]